MENEKQVLSPKMKRKLKSNAVGFSFVLPSLLGYAIFVFIPVCFSLILSLMEWDASQAPLKFVGLQNFVTIFGDRNFRNSFIHTVTYSLMTVFPTLVISLLLAVLMNSKIRGITFFRAAFYFPHIVSVVAVGAVWNMLFQPDYGPINMFLKFIGISNPPRWVLSTTWAMPAVAIVSVWKNMGYYMIIYLAGLQGIDHSLHEAASIDGANGWQRLRYITVPLLTPTTFFVLIMLTIQCFKVFDLVYVMTGGGPGNATQTLVNYIYTKAFTSWKLGEASAAAMIMFVVVLAVTLIQFAGERKWSDQM
ncbi:MAG: sugar ABC transporter permease [Lachnospiraceae bacterium]|nr:sugar ABC transporter permease [Lachnospiraceae bacterium]